MAEVNVGAVEQALAQAFDGQPVPKSARAPSPEVELDEAPEAETQEEDSPADEPVAEDVDEEAAEPVVEPEFEIEFNGTREVVRGTAQIKEMLQKARDYSQKSEQNARIRDALQAQHEQLQISSAFQRTVFEDVTQLQALDGQLEQFNKIDWAAAFDSDPFNALKLKEQRDQLREVRNAKLHEFQSKQQQFQQGQAQAAQQKLAAEHNALLAKLPEWRNSEKATTEQKSIAGWLQESGYSQAELAGLNDHRALVVARKAWLYDQLQAGKSAQLKQVRTAPPVVKPGATVQAQTKGKAAFAETMKDVRKAGQRGNHKAQEQLVQKMFDRAFK